MKAHRGRLLSGSHQPGTPVHAASFIRQREIVLENALLAAPGKLRRILTHELFHFVWARLGNKNRASFTALIQAERTAGARGELGESAYRWKPGNFKNYVCESFCDTAAWLYSQTRTSSEFTLAAGWRAHRKGWFESAFDPHQSHRC